MEKVICIDDSNFPNEIPLNKRVKKGEIYTIIKINKLNGYNGILGVQIEEIDLSEYAPYLYFALSRFAPINPESIIEEEEVELITV